MFYSDEIIRDVISANDIIDVISGYVSLKKSGRGFMGLCPFHNEKTPSFHVSADKQLYHCFGCGEGGTVANFIMKAENLDFVETVKLLADKAHIALPEPDNAQASQETQVQKQRIYQANAVAARFFYNNLIGESGKDALLYFTARGFLKKAITSFGLGYAQNSRNALIEHMKTLGYSPEELALFGLAIIKDDKIIDKFRNRIMFPIIDLRGNVIAFGGRVMDDSIPKYLNSPETLAFNKSRNLFALNFAKNSGTNILILVEGYMDVISLHQAGITNVVATLGTALTDDQAKLLVRYAKDIIICYDTDAAGSAATLRAIDILSAAGARVKTLIMQDAKDPDEYINKFSAESFTQLVNNAVAGTQFRLDLLKSQYNIDNIEEKIRFVGEAAKVLAGLENMIEVDAYVADLSESYDIKKESVFAEIKKIQGKQNRFKRIKSDQSLRTVSTSDSGSAQSGPIQMELTHSRTSKCANTEKLLISLIFSNKSVAKKAAAELKPEGYSDAVHKKLAELCYSYWEADTAPDVSKILSGFSPEDSSYIASILCKNSVYDDELSACTDFIQTIRLERLAKQIASETDPVRVNELVQKQAQLKKGEVPYE